MKRFQNSDAFARASRRFTSAGIRHFLNFSLIFTMLLTLGVGQMWATISFTVGVTGTGSGDGYGGSGYNTMKLNAQFYWTNTEKGWLTNTMTKAGITFEGLDLYTTSMTYNDAIETWHMQFQKYNGNYQIWSWDAMSGVAKTGDYWNSYIVAYGGARYSQISASSGAKFYFDASNWSQSAIKFVIGHAYYQTYYSMSNITGTKLYYISTSAYSGAMGIGVVGGSSRNGGTNQQLPDVSANAAEYTGWKNYGLTSNGAKNAYLMTNNGKVGEQPTMYYFSDYTGQDGSKTLQFNNTQTYNTVVKAAGGSYTSANSKATINISSYELTSQGGTTARTPELSTSESSETVSACRTATTRLQVGTPTTGYQFDGWYTEATGGTKVSSASDYTYYPTSANTYYARFSEKTFSVTFTSGEHGSVTTPSSSPQTVGQVTGLSINASADPGYYFSGWTVESGTATFDDVTDASTKVYPTAATTIKANFLPIWRIACSDDDHNTDTKIITNITASAGTMTSGYVDVTLAGNTDYNFKVFQKSTNAWWGNNSTVVKITYDDQTYRTLSSGSGSYQTFRTAASGTYRFTWDVTNSRVTITYPTSYKVTYNANGSTGGSVPADNDYYASGTTITVKTNSGSLAKTGYTYGGWNTQADGSGTNYTAGTGTFSIIADITLFAKWTQNISLDREGGTTGSTSLSATYNAVLSTAGLTLPTKENYDFAGYWTGDNGTGDMVINAAGEVQTVASWTDGDKKWIHNAASTLYAKWTEKTHTVTLANDDHGVVKIGDSEVTEVTAGEVTASSAITAVANTGYHFANWAIPSGVTIASGSENSATITINATADSKTVTANFAANDYTITLDANGGTGGTASVIATYDATPPIADGLGNYKFDITNPTKPGCTFLGWYTAADGGDLVINTDGTFNAPVADYTSNYPGNIWIHPDNATLYAHWEVVRYVIYHHGQAPEGGDEAYEGGTISLPIEYRRKFEKDTWYTIYFPFVVTAVQVFDDEDGLFYDLKPYYRSSNGVLHSRHYIIRKATPATDMDISKFESKIGESGWLDPEGADKTAVDSWLPEKNTPYMIQFHNDYYTDKWIAFIGAAGSTFATNFELGDAPADSGFVNIYGNNTLHDASLSVQTYMLNYDEYEGKAWTRCDAGTTLHPFEVYMRADVVTTAQYQVLGRRPKQEDTATAVDDIYNETSCLRVYTLTGQLLLTLYHITPDDAGRQLQQQLGQGIYILHSDHSSYKLIIGGH